MDTFSFLQLKKKADKAYTGKNLFNKNSAISGYFVNYADGTLNANASYYVSDYIAVQPITKYTRYVCRQMAFYDANKTYISGIATDATKSPFTFTTPVNAAFVRISMNGTTELNNEQVEIGSSRTAYESYGDRIAVYAVLGKNLFNQATITDNYFINYSDGSLTSNSSYAASDYIPVKGGKTYTASHNRDLAFYDANKAYISGIDDPGTPTPKTFTTPANAAYLRISIKKATTPANSFMVVEGSSLPTYEAYSYYLDSNIVGGTGSGSSASAFVNDIVMPSKLYMLNGAINHVYVEPIIKRWRPYDDFVRFSGTIPFTRRYSRMMGSKYPVEGNTLIVDLVNSDNFTITREITVTISVGNKAVGTGTITIQIVGDSYTHGAFFKDALLDKGYVPGLRMVGLRKVTGYSSPSQYDEGRGGWSLNDYFSVNTSPTSPYHGFMQPSGNFRYWGATGFWKNCYGVINGTLTDWTYTYNCSRFDDYVNKFNSSTGFLVSPAEGDIMYDTANSTYKVYTSGAWVSTTYGTYTWGFDYSKYLSMWGITVPSTMFVMLGLNDFRDNYGADFTTWNTQIMTMKSSYLAANPSGKFVICIPCSTTGTLENTAGDFTAKQHAAMWNFRKNVINTFDGREAESIYLVDVGATVDNQYGYDKSTQDWDTLPFDGFTGTARLDVQINNPHPYPNYPIMGIPLAGFLQHYRTDV